MDLADKKITVLEVLYQVGFNSKSSFNTLFKKQTGVTPSEFKKKSQARTGG
jgi:AraC-like DNA-binding protein